MNKKPNKAVLFDLDGTLIDTAPDMIYALKTVLQNNNINTSISDKTLRKYVSDSNEILIDGAHNPLAALEVEKYLRTLNSERKIN